MRESFASKAETLYEKAEEIYLIKPARVFESFAKMLKGEYITMKRMPEKVRKKEVFIYRTSAFAKALSAFLESPSEETRRACRESLTPVGKRRELCLQHKRGETKVISEYVQGHEEEILSSLFALMEKHKEYEEQSEFLLEMTRLVVE